MEGVQIGRCLDIDICTVSTLYLTCMYIDRYIFVGISRIIHLVTENHQGRVSTDECDFKLGFD